MSYRVVDRGLVPEEYKYKENVRPLDKPWFGLAKQREKEEPVVVHHNAYVSIC